MLGLRLEPGGRRLLFRWRSWILPQTRADASAWQQGRQGPEHGSGEQRGCGWVGYWEISLLPRLPCRGYRRPGGREDLERGASTGPSTLSHLATTRVQCAGMKAIDLVAMPLSVTRFLKPWLLIRSRDITSHGMKRWRHALVLAKASGTCLPVPHPLVEHGCRQGCGTWGFLANKADNLPHAALLHGFSI